jgi:hypothetical protein
VKQAVAEEDVLQLDAEAEPGITFAPEHDFEREPEPPPVRHAFPDLDDADQELDVPAFMRKRRD